MDVIYTYIDTMCHYSLMNDWFISAISYVVLMLFFSFMLANRVTLKDLKAFLPRVNCKIATNRLRELFQEVDTRNRNELGFDDFVILYHKLMFDQNVSKYRNILEKWSALPALVYAKIVIGVMVIFTESRGLA